MHMSRLRVRGMRASADGQIEVTFPGRFTILVGANASGKTSICDAAYLAHTRTLPRLPRASAAALGSGDRFVEVDYEFAAASELEGPLGLQIQAQSGRNAPGTVAATWTRTLKRDLGRISATTTQSSEHMDSFRLVYLPAWRNPVDELARREARILVELLRAQQQNRGHGRSLIDLRRRASRLLEQLAQFGLIEAVEARIGAHLRALSAGVSRNWPYVRGQAIDDTYLARVLELMLASLEGREYAVPLEVSGLGYVNLLHSAVTLAAIPDAFAASITPSRSAVGAADEPGTTASTAPNEPTAGDSSEETADVDEVQAATESMRQAQSERDSEEDSFFPSAPFHATVVIEEPEAHLHPQLQHSLVRYLRRAGAARATGHPVQPRGRRDHFLRPRGHRGSAPRPHRSTRVANDRRRSVPGARRCAPQDSATFGRQPLRGAVRRPAADRRGRDRRRGLQGVRLGMGR